MTTFTTFPPEHALRRMRRIIEREHIDPGLYVDLVGTAVRGVVGDDAPCGGNRACMIGAALIGLGVPFEEVTQLAPQDRDHVTRKMAPGWGAMLDALNAAAAEVIEELGLYVSDDPDAFTRPVEQLFEDHYTPDGRVDSATMLDVVDRAIAIVTAVAVRVPVVVVTSPRATPSPSTKSSSLAPSHSKPPRSSR